MKDTPHRVWDHNLQAMRDLAEDEWELESHWAGALEVHGKKMPGHDWIVVVPKHKLTAAEARSTAAEAALTDARRHTELVATSYASLLDSGWRNSAADLYRVAVELAERGVSTTDDRWNTKVAQAVEAIR